MKREATLPRAKQVREKRNTQGNQVARRKKTSGARLALPPVMVRGGTPASVQNSRAKTKRVKRRYDIALPAPGVEMRLPAVPVIRVGWRLVSFMFVLLLSGVLYYLFTSPVYRVKDVEIAGGVYLSSESISRMMLIYNQPIFLVEPQVIASQLVDTLDGLTSAAVTVSFPAQVTVTVEERAPVLVWELDGQAQWVDAQGFAFPPRGDASNLVRVVASTPPPAPIILDEGEETGESHPLMTPEMVTAILSVRNYAPDSVDLLYDGEHGFGWHDPHGWIVYFGMDDDNVKMKIAIYDTLLRHLNREGIQPAMISVEYLHAPFYRLEP
ncbi:MAG: FtsQ-type POTRA domain-containing protein [Anaerolineae bacterium]|nr:FtsQ-type POTRA domain-containing protein [Anaerolineae bacterium]